MTYLKFTYYKKHTIISIKSTTLHGYNQRSSQDFTLGKLREHLRNTTSFLK